MQPPSCFQIQKTASNQGRRLQNRYVRSGKRDFRRSQGLSERMLQVKHSRHMCFNCQTLAFHPFGLKQGEQRPRMQCHTIVIFDEFLDDSRQFFLLWSCIVQPYPKASTITRPGPCLSCRRSRWHACSIRLIRLKPKALLQVSQAKSVRVDQHLLPMSPSKPSSLFEPLDAC